MKIYRKKTRELLMRLVFQMTTSGDFSDEAKETFMKDRNLFKDIFDEGAGEAPDMAYFNWAYSSISNNLVEIDRVIAEASEKWTIERMQIVDLSILRVAVAELMYMGEIEDSVSVNEAILMAKKYGSKKSSAFINGILGTVSRSRGEGQVT